MFDYLLWILETRLRGVIVKNQLELSKADWMATSKLYAWLAEADFEQSA